MIDFTNRESITTAILSAAVSFITIQISNKEEIPGFDNRVFVNTILNIPLFLTSLVLSFFILPSLIVISPDANGLPAFIGLFIYFLVWMIPYVYYFLLIMWSLLWIRNDRMGKEYYCKTIGFKDYIRLDYLKSTKSDKRDLIFNLESILKVDTKNNAFDYLLQSFIIEELEEDIKGLSRDNSANSLENILIMLKDFQEYLSFRDEAALISNSKRFSELIKILPQDNKEQFNKVEKRLEEIIGSIKKLKIYPRKHLINKLIELRSKCYQDIEETKLKPDKEKKRKSSCRIPGCTSISSTP